MLTYYGNIYVISIIPLVFSLFKYLKDSRPCSGKKLPSLICSVKWSVFSFHFLYIAMLCTLVHILQCFMLCCCNTFIFNHLPQIAVSSGIEYICNVSSIWKNALWTFLNYGVTLYLASEDFNVFPSCTQYIQHEWPTIWMWTGAHVVSRMFTKTRV